MKLTDNFNTAIDTKITRGIDWDKLPKDVQDNAKKLAENAQAIRNAIGLLITVTSGYRPAAVNTNAGGSKSSQHLFGEAWDITVKGQTREVLDDISRAIMEGRIKLPHPCSQVIVETNSNGSSWIHLGIKTDRWIDYSKNILNGNINSVTRAKHTKRLTSCEFLSTHDTKTFTTVGYRFYGDFGVDKNGG